ncbi:MAG: hypothetical protein PHO69_10690 [Petrimonas sp.]|nr:hypothetical protein [Petrimonas sp.]
MLVFARSFPTSSGFSSSRESPSFTIFSARLVITGTCNEAAVKENLYLSIFSLFIRINQLLHLYDKKDNRQDLCLNINGSGTTNMLRPVCQVSFSAVLFTYMFISGTHGCCITNIGIKTVKQ